MDSQDEFIILACDGLWDVMTSKRAVESVRLSLRRHNDPDKAAKVNSKGVHQQGRPRDCSTGPECGLHHVPTQRCVALAVSRPEPAGMG